MQQKNYVSISLLLFWKCFLLICLPLWTLPTFLKIKYVWKIKNVKKRKNVFTSMASSWCRARKRPGHNKTVGRPSLHSRRFASGPKREQSRPFGRFRSSSTHGAVCVADQAPAVIVERENKNKKLSYRRGTARCVVSVEILPVATQQCTNYL